MSFGLTNASASFQRYINMILVEKFDIFVIVYLDDILIYTEDERDSHVAVIWWVLKQLKKFLLYANLKKYWFYQDKVLFLSCMVSLKGICIEDKRIETIMQWPEP